MDVAIIKSVPVMSSWTSKIVVRIMHTVYKAV